MPPIDSDGLVAHYELDGSFSDISGSYHHGRTIARRSDVRRRQGRQRGVRSTATPRSASATSARSIAAQPFSAGGLAEGRHGNLPMTAFQKLDADRRGIRVDVRRHRAGRHPALGGASSTSGWPAAPGAAAIEIRTARAAAASRDWHHIALTYDGSGKAAGLHLYRERPAARRRRRARRR